MARIVWNTNRPYMATVSPGTFTERPCDPGASGEIVRVEKNLNETSSGIHVVSSVREPHQTAKLEDARIVVAGGRGVRNSEGFKSVRELALLLGGEVGATRPAVDAHWTSHEQLIGQTGASIKPELLITCGTSGAVQYTAAIGGSGTVVAVNRDRHASDLQDRRFRNCCRCTFLSSCLYPGSEEPSFPGDYGSVSEPGQDTKAGTRSRSLSASGSEK